MRIPNAIPVGTRGDTRGRVSSRGVAIQNASCTRRAERAADYVLLNGYASAASPSLVASSVLLAACSFVLSAYGFVCADCGLLIVGCFLMLYFAPCLLLLLLLLADFA